jgi:hypothetical protein
MVLGTHNYVVGRLPWSMNEGISTYTGRDLTRAKRSFKRRNGDSKYL